MSDEIKNKLYNIDIVVDEIRNFPQTYKTILKEKCTDGTCNIILRRKLSNLIKDGTVCKTNIPGTRFGKVIYYALPKKYYILIESERLGSNVFVFFNYEHSGKFYIIVEEYWKLEHGCWVKYNEKKSFFQGKVLKWI